MTFIRYGSRKFILAMAVLVLATWLVASGHISDDVYSAVVIANCVAYIAGNVSQKKLTQTGAQNGQPSETGVQ